MFGLKAAAAGWSNPTGSVGRGSWFRRATDARNEVLMRRVLAVTGGTTVVLVLWGTLFWALIAPRIGVFHQLPNDEGVTALLVQAGVQTGTYFMPWPRNTPETFERFVAQHRSGPFYRLSYVRDGVDPQSPSKMLKGTLQTFLTALCGVLIAFLTGSTRAFDRFAVVFLAGLIGSLYITVADPVWFDLPWDNARGVLAYQLVSWALMAAMCARFVRSSRAASPARVEVRTA